MRGILLYITFSVFSQTCQGTYKESDTEFWYQKGDEELNRALRLVQNHGVAKNVILFLGDGMGMPTLTAARILKGQKAGKSGEEGALVFEEFPNVGAIKTYNIDKQVPDSAGTATAYLSGVKTNYGLLGLNAKVPRGDCNATGESGTRVSTIAEWALDNGKDAGVVTTTRITHATPGALYAKSADRNWECSTPDNYCKDIARQLVEESPGKRLKVILGGGRQQLQQYPKESDDDQIDSAACTRNDGKDLIDDWKKSKSNKGQSYEFVETTEQLLDVDPEKTDYLMGIFANSNLPYEKLRNASEDGVPTLTNMTVAALKMLSKNKNGFVLLVEAGRIDHAHHQNLAHLALEEAVELDNAIKKALEFVDVKETLVLVTADHSHVMTINGYPNRGNPILGVGGIGGDKSPYTTLLYTNGPAAEDTYFVCNGKAVRRDPSIQDIHFSDPNYRSQAIVPMEDETHGGEDVLVYAIGPMSHLFHTLHEQSYIAHVISYSACIGPVDVQHCRARLNPEPADPRISRTDRSDASIMVSRIVISFLPLLASRLMKRH